VQPHALARDVRQRDIEGVATTRSTKPWKSFSGLSAVGQMALERQVRAVELEQEAALHDGLVLDPQRLAERRQVGVLARVVLVSIAAAMMPGDGAVRNGSTKPPGAASRAARKSSHSASTSARSRYLTSRSPWRHEVGRPRPWWPASRRSPSATAGSAGRRRAASVSTGREPAHALAHVQEERLALAARRCRNVDPAARCCAITRSSRRARRGERGLVDRFACVRST